MNDRHRAKLAEDLANLVTQGQLPPVRLSGNVHYAAGLARAFAPVMRRFMIDNKQP